MYFNYICYQCGKQTSSEIHPVNITEFYCPGCDEHIGCSNTKIIKLINPKRLKHYTISVSPEDIIIHNRIGHVQPFYSTTGVTSYYGSGTTTDVIYR
jgi:DNA-directed RNA polymerase subunit RPC12/RpoP